MLLVKVNGVKCALVERTEVAERLKIGVEGIARLFGAATPKVEFEPMPECVMGGGNSAEHSAFVALVKALQTPGE